jgi:hypothetical protein
LLPGRLDKALAFVGEVMCVGRADFRSKATRRPGSVWCLTPATPPASGSRPGSGNARPQLP